MSGSGIGASVENMFRCKIFGDAGSLWGLLTIFCGTMVRGDVRSDQVA
jgi:hypothetical protein